MTTYRRLTLDSSLDEEYKTLRRQNRFWLSFVCNACRPVKWAVTERMDITGVDEFQELEKPYLWVLKHDSHWDLPLFLSSNATHVKARQVRIVGRKGYLPGTLDTFVQNRLKSVYLAFDRTKYDEFDSDEEKERARELNRAKMASVKQDMRAGFSSVILPEATTKTRTGFNHLSRGVYYLSHFDAGGGTVERVPCVPIGHTEDRLSGNRYWKLKRLRAFTHIGEPFFYERVPAEPGESYERWERRDIAEMKDRIHERFLDLHTITSGELVSRYLLEQAAQGEERVTENELEIRVQTQAARLHEEGYLLDGGLLSPPERQRMITNCLDEMPRYGFGTREERAVIIDTDAFLAEPPEGANYKTVHPFKYNANRLAHVERHRQGLGELLSA